MTKVAWWHCAAGIAGDMALASLLDAGADLDAVLAGLRSLPVGGWHLEAARTTKGGLVATAVRVEVRPGQEEPERTWRTVRAIIDDAHALPVRARDRAQSVFSRLAAAEGRIHGVTPDEVHFHEVGSVDAIIDVVGTCLALESLDVGSVHASSVALGTGTIRSAHGTLPNPAPAVLELLSGVPVYGTLHGLELTTPTGAALLAALSESFGPLPAVCVMATGYGAGTADLDGAPNVLQVVIGERQPDNTNIEGEYRQLAVLETNVDDVTGEVLAHTVTALLAAGALDAWLVPVLAKKGRPGHIVGVLAEPASVPALARILAVETGTLGTRQYSVQRSAFPRRTVEVEVDGLSVRVKAGPHRLKAEHDDCARVAGQLGLPVSEVARRAEEAAAGHARVPVE